MYELAMNRWVSVKRFDSTTRDRFVGWVYVNNLVGVDVHLPDDFLYVVRYIAKALFALAQGSFSSYTLRYIAEDEEVTSGEVVCRDGEVNENCLRIASEHLCQSSVKAALQEVRPITLEVVAVPHEVANIPPDQLLSWNP